MEILTLGHSTRTLKAFLSLLEAHGVRILADIRRYPASRRHPHFTRASIEEALKAIGVEYVWLPGLGGRRNRRKDSPHTAWREAGFAGYADHMESEEFLTAANDLLRLAARSRTAVMCAEALPERCHRRLLSDWLLVHEATVLHVLDLHRTKRHELTPFSLVVEGGRLVYDRGQQELALSSESADHLPDVRDGLTRRERAVLVVLSEVQEDLGGRFVPTPLLYGRLVERMDMSMGELQAILERLGARVGVPPPLGTPPE